MASERVTVTFPPEVVRAIDRQERNRSKFVLEAVRRELERRQREEFHRSLDNPHPESRETAELGLEDWAKLMSPEDEDLLDPAAGKDVRWVPGEGWIEVGG